VKLLLKVRKSLLGLFLSLNEKLVVCCFFTCCSNCPVC
jgi:hypothetical protein